MVGRHMAAATDATTDAPELAPNRTRGSVRQMVLALAIAVAITAIFLPVSHFLGVTFGEYTWGYFIPIVVLKLVPVICVLALGGRKLLAPHMLRGGEAFRVAWRLCWLPVVLNLLPFGLGLIGLATGRSELAVGWPTRLAVGIGLVLTVGIFEESLCRGLLFQGLLARMGSSRRGIVAASVISSAFFGIIHVVVGVELNPWWVLTAVLKIVQAGWIGFLFCVAVIKTRSLLPCFLFHSLFDINVIIGAIFDQQIGAGAYTTDSPEAAMGQAVMYGIFIIVYVVGSRRALRTLRQIDVPDYGELRRGESATS